MKTQFSHFRHLAVFVGLFLSAQTSFASIFKDAELENFLGRLHDAALDHPTLIYFGYQEADQSAPIDTTGAVCVEAGAQRLAEYLSSVAAMLLPENECDQQCERALDQLSALTSGHKYLECTRSSTAAHSFTEISLFIAEDKSHSLSFELGYSD
jgi:hypothetical protein